MIVIFASEMFLNRTQRSFWFGVVVVVRLENVQLGSQFCSVCQLSARGQTHSTSVRGNDLSTMRARISFRLQRISYFKSHISESFIFQP